MNTQTTNPKDQGPRHINTDEKLKQKKGDLIFYKQGNERVDPKKTEK